MQPPTLFFPRKLKIASDGALDLSNLFAKFKENWLKDVTVKAWTDKRTDRQTDESHNYDEIDSSPYDASKHASIKSTFSWQVQNQCIRHHHKIGLIQYTMHHNNQTKKRPRKKLRYKFLYSAKRFLFTGVLLFDFLFCALLTNKYVNINYPRSMFYNILFRLS